MKIRIGRQQTKQGSALAVTLLTCGILGLLMGSYLYLVQGQRQSVARSQNWNSAIVVAEAGIDVDGSLHGSVIQAGIHKPFMFLLSGYGDFSSDAETRQIKADIQSVYDRLPGDGRVLIAIRGANHFTFSDDGALLKSHIVLRTLGALGVVGIDGRRQLAVTTYCVRSFFDAYLKRASVSRLKVSSPLYPEIQVLE